MLLIFTQKLTPRIDFVFKQICGRILGMEIGFTSVIEEFISHEGPKLSYAKQPMGNEFFIQSYGLLESSGIEDMELQVKPWDDSYCFFSVGERSKLPFDIFSAAFFLLSRYEEYLPHLKDELGRYPAQESLGFQNGFLSQPVVDIWAYKLKVALQQAFPNIDFPKKKGTVHTLLRIDQPYRYIQKGFVRSLVGYWKELSKLKFRSVYKRSRVLMGPGKDPYDQYDWLIDVVGKSNNKLTAFFLLGDHHVLRNGFNSRREKIRSLIKFVGDYSEVGLLFSYNALDSTDVLKTEKKQLEEITHRALSSSMNSDFLVLLPELYRELVEQEIERDFSMVYENTPGYRAGTCTPFLFYDLDYEIKTPLVIHPIAFTTEGFNKKYESDSLQRIMDMHAQAMRLNGTFSVLFNIHDFCDQTGNSLWRNLFSEKLHLNGN
ncbi:hypothetical protein J1N09_09860 [Aureitalea sp. L0-47]|uniref:DUF7033 domain-containing protein n=1 Tax=Aureitalea sp. L0-47 TaxID=2816962 RepID=UPI002237981E|nr:hypothetical protein [Aureitalea sp. L0-47]MCW5520144.1 hypothetical protein [Aureitalea sp. L0-47]